MRTESATNLKTHFGQALTEVSREPIVVQKSGRNVAVLLSYEEYERLEKLEDQYWLKRAKQAEQEGYIGTKKSEKLLQDLLNAKD